MHASEKIGLIAGHGELPKMMLERWKSLGYSPVIVALSGVTDPVLLHGHEGRFFGIGQAGAIFSYLAAQNVRKIVLVGALRRPNFWTLATDAVGFMILLKLLLRRMGDDSLLKSVRREFEMRGFSLAGVHEFLPEVLASSGQMGKVSVDEKYRALVARGIALAKQHGAEDKGQSVVLSADGECFLETALGTGELIRSVRGRIAKGQMAVLVKMSKPQQDLALDMPTIGPETVRQAVLSGLDGIVVEAGKTLIVDKAEVVRLCDESGLFLMGMGEEGEATKWH